MGVTACGRGAGKTLQGSHVFEISGYSLHRERLGASKCVQSAVFDVDGHDWQIMFFPGGISHALSDYVAVYLSLWRRKNNTAKVKASIEFSLVDVAGSSPPHTMTMELGFCSSDTVATFNGHKKFKKRSELEAPPYLRDDRIVIQCVITLDKESSFIQSSLKVPPSDIMEHLRKLWQGKDGADVVFDVDGEAFPAHKTILAMRSPVFRAELYGGMREKDMNRITIGDMQPAVFEALLHFMYTDSLPNMDGLGGEDYEETIRHLLVAADRYAVERLKMMCESIICNNIDVKTVITALALADQHRCGRLSDACLQFIASLDKTEMNDVMASQGYAELKGTCPNLDLLELWEKAYRLRNSKSSVHIGSLVT